VIPSRSLYRRAPQIRHHPVASVKQGDTYHTVRIFFPGPPFSRCVTASRSHRNFNYKLILAKRRLRMYEVGISYLGRTDEEGKKMGWKDSVRAL
jgi:hypothetical protein